MSKDVIASRDDGLSVRAFNADDAIFAQALFEQVKTDEWQAWHWGEAERGLLLSMQYRAFVQHFAQAEGLSDRIVWHGPERVGRILTMPEDGALLIGDIAIRAEFRGQGLGGRVLQCLRKEEAVRHLRLNCAIGNRAFNLYVRLGFREVGRSDTHVCMEWPV